MCLPKGCYCGCEANHAGCSHAGPFVVAKCAEGNKRCGVSVRGLMDRAFGRLEVEIEATEGLKYGHGTSVICSGIT